MDSRIDRLDRTWEGSELYRTIVAGQDQLGRLETRCLCCLQQVLIVGLGSGQTQPLAEFLELWNIPGSHPMHCDIRPDFLCKRFVIFLQNSEMTTHTCVLSLQPHFFLTRLAAIIIKFAPVTFPQRDGLRILFFTHTALTTVMFLRIFVRLFSLSSKISST